MGDRAFKDTRKNERVDTHHDKRIQQRPEHAQGHIPIADSEVLQDELAEKVRVVAGPHVGRFGRLFSSE